jgi:hypothetical protein
MAIADRHEAHDPILVKSRLATSQGDVSESPPNFRQDSTLARLNDEVIMSIAGHVSRAMLSRYSHVRMEANRREQAPVVSPSAVVQ